MQKSSGEAFHCTDVDIGPIQMTMSSYDKHHSHTVSLVIGIEHPGEGYVVAVYASQRWASYQVITLNHFTSP